MPLRVSSLKKGDLIFSDPGTSLMTIEPPAFFEEYKRPYTPWLTITSLSRDLISKVDIIAGEGETLFYLGSCDQTHPTLFETKETSYPALKKRFTRVIHEVLWRGSVFRMKSDHLSRFCSRYREKSQKK